MSDLGWLELHFDGLVGDDPGFDEVEWAIKEIKQLQHDLKSCPCCGGLVTREVIGRTNVRVCKECQETDLKNEAKIDQLQRENRKWLKANSPGGWIDELRGRVEEMRDEVLDLNQINDAFHNDDGTKKLGELVRSRWQNIKSLESRNAELLARVGELEREQARRIRRIGVQDE